MDVGWMLDGCWMDVGWMLDGRWSTPPGELFLFNAFFTDALSRVRPPGLNSPRGRFLFNVFFTEALSRVRPPGPEFPPRGVISI